MLLRPAAILLVVAAAACGPVGGGGAAGPPGPRLAASPTPGPALGDEPPAPKGALGAAWLEEVHERFHPRWSNTFLEQTRLYLPPDHPLNDPSLEVTLRFTVGADGAARGLETVRSSGNSDFDGAARELVSEAGEPGALPAPPEALRSDDGDVRVTWRFARDARQDAVAGATVTRVLWEPERAVPALLAAGRVGEAAERVAQAFADAKGEDAARAVLPLARQVAGGALVTALLDEKDPGVRIEAAHAVAAARWTEALPALRKLALEANDLLLQAAALRALGDLHDEASEKLFSDVVERLEDERSSAAAGALVKLGKASELWGRLAPAALGTDLRQRAAALADLVEAPVDDSAPVLVSALGDRLRPRPERVNAAIALGGLAASPDGPPAKALVAAIGDGDAAVRAAVAAGLARAGAERGLRSKPIAKKVAPLLRDRDPRVQAAAARAAALLDGKTALADLTTLALRAPDPVASGAAVSALGTIPGPEALAALQKLAAARTLDTRSAALHALATRPEPDARAALAPLVSDPDPHLRILAVRATTDLETLRRALSDPAPEVRAAAVAPLVRLAGEVTATPLIMRALADAHASRDRVLISRELLAP